MSKRKISVEIFRDSETPDISIDEAIAGLEEVQSIIEPLEIIARNSLLQLSRPGAKKIHTEDITSFDIQSDFGIILTGRKIIVPSRMRRGRAKGRITVGNTWPNGLSVPFAMIDAERSYSVKNSTKHEVGHLLKIPRSGEGYDGDCHCTDTDCVMHPIMAIERSGYCIGCNGQLVNSAFNLIKYQANL